MWRWLWPWDSYYYDYHYDKKKKLYRRIWVGILIFIILILFIILLIWLILRPTKPRFTLQNSTVYTLNVSSPNILTTNLQVTFSSKNPNDKIGIYYDKLDVYASYRNQQITLPSVTQPTYQGHNEVNIWSPFLYSTSIPVAPYLAEALSQDQAAGMLLINVRIDGRVRWKVGSWISGHYHLFVNCPASLTFGDRNTSMPVGPIDKYQMVQYQMVQDCNVDV